MITPLLTAMTATAVVEVGEGRAPDARRAIQAGLDVFAPLLAVLVLVFLGVLCGILLLVLPGIYLAVRWFVAPQTVVIEGKQGPEALAALGGARARLVVAGAGRRDRAQRRGGPVRPADRRPRSRRSRDAVDSGAVGAGRDDPRQRGDAVVRGARRDAPVLRPARAGGGRAGRRAGRRRRSPSTTRRSERPEAALPGGFEPPRPDDEP